MKKFLILLSSVLLISGVTSCSSKNENTIPEEDRICLIGEHMKEYLSLNKPIKEFENIKDDKQVPYTINFEGNSSSYIFELSLFSDFKDMISTRITSNHISLTNLLIDSTYYYRITPSEGTDIIEGNFTTQSYAPRVISIDGINNVRDLGGWTYEGNNKIAQGLIYRGSEMNNKYNITQDGILTMNETLNIKTDLDLRTDLEASYITSSPLGENVDYIHLPSFKGYMDVIKDNQKENYKTIFKLLANPNSYPIYFHCYQGADRTGTLASMILGLMGVSDQDRIIDYNLTTFSSGDDCYRDGESTERNYSFIQKNIQLKFKGESFRESMELYLKDFLGLTSEEIDSIRNILSNKINIPNIQIGQFLE